MSYIVVVGSLNMDLVVTTQHLPAAGETVMGKGFATIPGGKGANQAVAASRMGGDTRMVGAVGNDAFGLQLKASLRDAGVDISQVIEKPDVSTGTATIIVDHSGDNRIIVVAGANGQLLNDDIDRVETLIAAAGLLVLQFEIPFPTTQYLVDLAQRHAVPVMLNPAPAGPVPPGFLQKIKYLILNESEAEFFSGQPVSDVESGFLAAESLHDQGCETVIITLGALGALALSEDLRFHAPAKAVEVVDTTAAGDTFVGALAVELLDGGDIEQAIKLAVLAGTVAVTRLGAQPSIPTKEQLRSFIHFQGARS